MKTSNPDRWVELTSQVISPQQLTDFVTTPRAGAVVLFLGTVREWTQARQTASLEYEAYTNMALRVMQDLVEETCQRWPILKAAVVHRLGYLGHCETSVAIAVSSPHRHDAFSAGQYLIDQLKVRVPIWKKEHWKDGTSEWIHPGHSTNDPEPGRESSKPTSSK